MAQPTQYARGFSFTNWTAAHPTLPLPGGTVDAELNAIQLTFGQALDNLALIQRDDGHLANASVYPETLAASTLALIAAVGPQGPQGPTGAPGIAGGTVSSASLTMPAAIFSIAGATLTSTPAFTVTFTNQNANLFFAGPATGGATTPSMRAMVTADIPDGIVTLAKQANMATGSVVYRKTAAAGPPEIQTLATLKADLGLTGTNSGDQAVPTEASSAEGWTGASATKFISPGRMFALAANVSVAYAATIALDFNTGINFKIGALTGALLLDNPTNTKSGQNGKIKLPQDGTGGRIISYGSNWRFASGKAVSGVLSTAANALDHLSYFVEDDGTITATLAKAFS